MYNYNFYYAQEKYYKTYHKGALTKNNMGFTLFLGSHYTYYIYNE